MTADELREELARMMGWGFRHNSWWHPTEPGICYHPVPLTADAALDAFGRLCPGMAWSKQWYNGAWTWFAFHSHHRVTVPDTGDFTADLMRLTVEAVRAMKGHPQ